MKILTVSLEDRNFGLPIALIQEILVNFDITPVDLAPEDIEGLMNVRGQIVTVINPHTAFQIEASAEAQNSRVIVFKKKEELKGSDMKFPFQDSTPNDLYSFKVDAVGDVNDLEPSAFEPLPANTPQKEAEYFTCVVRVGEQVYPLLNISKLIGDQAQQDIPA